MSPVTDLVVAPEEEVVLDIISFFKSDILNNDAAEISEHADIISEGLIDSMGIIRLLTHLQILYDIKDFDNTDLTLDNFRTIQRIADMIAKYRKPRMAR
jgi:acyl carrier protein